MNNPQGENPHSNGNYQLYQSQPTAAGNNHALHSLEISTKNKRPLLQQPPPSCCDSTKYWLFQCAWPGMGLFGESFLLFSIGTLKPIWEECAYLYIAV